MQLDEIFTRFEHPTNYQNPSQTRLIIENLADVFEINKKPTTKKEDNERFKCK